MNTRSLSFRLTIWYSGICLLVCGGFALCSYGWLHNYLMSSLSGTLERRSGQITSVLQLHLNDTEEQLLIRDIQAAFAPEQNGRFIRIRRVDGHLLYRSGVPTESNFDPAKIPINQELSEKLVITRNESQNVLIASRKLAVKGGEYLIEVGASLAPIDKILHSYAAMLAVGVPIVFLIAIGGGIILLRQSLLPVRRIIDAAKNITYHNINNRLPITDSGDELEKLSIVLNQMIERLEMAYQHSQRFSGLASHELRTPLTIIHGEIEALLRDRNLDGETKEKIGSILEEVQRLVKIVGGLFAITRLEAGEALLDSTSFNLSDLVMHTSEQMRLLADDKNITIRHQVEPNLEIIGDKARLKQVVVNLLDNAIKYSPPGEEILLSTQRENGEAVFEVIDSGYGIPAEALPHVFESFYRYTGNLIHPVEGAGLGLAIVRSICVAHGGTVQVLNREHKGSSFRVRIPLKGR